MVKSPRNSSSIEELNNQIKERPVRESLDPVRDEIRQRKRTYSGTVVQVVGSNGKGSVVHYVESLLAKFDTEILSYTSPHLVSVNERIRINATPISESTLSARVSEVQRLSKLRLTPFEKLFLSAYDSALEHEPSVLLLEAGMGGRWDATSAVPADITILTGVELEHTDRLGTDRTEILKEMTAQIPPETILISPRFNDLKIKETLQDRIRTKSLTGIRVTETETADGMNRSLATMTTRLLINRNVADLGRKLESINKPHGRSERVTVENRDIILDVAHTPAAIDELLNVVSADDSGKPILVYGSLQDKNIEAITSRLATTFPPSRTILTAPESPRGVDPVKLKKFWKSNSSAIETKNSPGEALDHALQLSSGNDTIYVTGSFELIANLKQGKIQS
jgi:dihydrofolate synthase/folylpolyglutamate synthase